MPAALPFLIFTRDGEYVAACAHAEDAAAVVALHGDGTEIRRGRLQKHCVWLEGKEGQPAGESFDYVATLVYERVEALDFGLDKPKASKLSAGRMNWLTPIEKEDS